MSYMGYYDNDNVKKDINKKYTVVIIMYYWLNNFFRADINFGKQSIF